MNKNWQEHSKLWSLINVITNSFKKHKKRKIKAEFFKLLQPLSYI